MIIDIVNYSLVIPQLCPLDKLFGSSPSAPTEGMNVRRGGRG